MSEEGRDRVLLRRVMEGDVAAFATLLDRYWHPVVRYVAQRLDSQDAAEDVGQEVFLRLWAARSRIRTHGAPRAYLFRIAHNLAVDELRRRGTRSRHAHLLEAERPAMPDQVLDDVNVAEAATAAVRALPERRREVFILAHFHGLSYREIAETLNITPRTVANHLTLALGDLRRSLRPLLDRRVDR